MKRFTKTILLTLTGILLTSCNIFGGLGGSNYSGYEEYFEVEKNFKKYTDIDLLNKDIDDTSYFWTKNESSDYTSYFTGKNVLIMVYSDRQLITLNFTDRKSVSIEEKDGVLMFETNEATIDGDGNKTIKAMTGDTALNMAKDNDGYLLVAYEKHMFYITKDLKNIYVNEKNTNVFQGYNDTKTIAESELLNNTLEALGADKRVKLPAPSNNVEIWYGIEYYKDKPSNGKAYIADTDVLDYVELLKNNGFTVIRSFEDPYYASYGEKGGYWYCYDEQEDMELLLSAVNYLYVDNKGTSYGPFNNTQVDIYRMNKGYSGEKERTNKEDWDSYDKATMNGWYDGTIDGSAVPFIPLGKNYSVPSTTTHAHSGFLDGTFCSDQQCYSIRDGSNKYFLDGYDEILEANNFHKYVPNYDLSNPKEKSDFFHTEECKFVNCFINEEKNMAIKYYFDVTFGNTIRVFKISEMKSWMTDLKQKAQ